MTSIKTTCALLFFLIFAHLGAQNSHAYRIEIEAPSVEDTVLYLGRYHGHKTYLIDTAYRHDGSFVFEGDKPLATGLYLLANNAKRNLMDMIVSESSQRYSIKAPKGFDIHNVKFVNSKENKRMQAYLIMAADNYAQAMRLRQRMSVVQSQQPDSVPIIQRQLDDNHKKEYAYRLKMIHKWPNSFLADVMHLLNNVDDDATYRAAATGAQGQLDSLRWYQVRKQHYWDHIKLQDDRLLRTPFLGRRIDDYFDHYVFFEADTVMTAIDHFLAQMRPGGEMYVYSLWYLLNKYEQSTVMGHDAVLVHLADTYFAEPIEGIHPVIAKNIVKKANARRSILIGRKAPELRGKDSTLRERALSDITAPFTIIAFWNPACSHCREEMPLLQDYYHKNKAKYGLAVMGVSTTPDPKSFAEKIKQWQLDFVNVRPMTERGKAPEYDYVATYHVDGTPLMYLLDRDKKIIAKHFGVQHLDMIIQHYLQQQAKR